MLLSRDVQSAKQNVTFWGNFIDVPRIEIDTAEVARIWKEARETSVENSGSKSNSPLEKIDLPNEIITSIESYQTCINSIERVSQSLLACNTRISEVKEASQSSDIIALKGDLGRLEAVKRRL
jgi:hypothetical protein